MAMDVYVACADVEELKRFCSMYADVIGPFLGRAAIEACAVMGEMADGVPGAGDVDKWYACVRSKTMVVVSGGIEIVSNVVGSSVCGVWA